MNIKRGLSLLFLILPLKAVGIENSIDTHLASCIHIWTKLDLLRAIKPCEEDRAACIEKITESFLLLYQPLISGLTANKGVIELDNIDSLLDTCEYIASYLEDIYSKKAHNSFVCSQVVLGKIRDHLTQFLTTQS